MKKLLTGCVFVVSAFAIHAAGNDTSKAMSENTNMAAFTVADTLPKKDTTKKDTMFSSAFAYRLVVDTMPRRDTIRKDTSYQAFAFNR